MKTILVALGLMMYASGGAAATSLLPERVNKAIQQRIAAGEYPALVVAVVDGKRSGVYSFGKLDNGKPLTADTLFEIGSVTKTFTALLLAEQVTSGALRLDTPVADLLPGFTVPSRNGKLITLENLATQHSGLPRLPGNLKPARLDDPYADYDGAKLKAFLASYALPRDPGSKYEYSNLGVGLLGYALAQRAGISYEALLKRDVFGPLGMHDSAITLDAAMRARDAGGHDAEDKPVANWHLNALAAAGGLSSSGADMLRYLQANMGLLETPLYTAMQLAQTPRDGGPGPNERIGLVWMTKHGADGDIIWHNGMTGGYASFMGFTSDHRHGVVILTNAQRSVDDLGFASLSAQASLAPAHKRITLPPKALDAYVGNYQLAPGFILNIFRDHDQLIAQATGQGPLPIFASATDEFFANIADISISFKRDAGGRVYELVLHQHGDHVAPKISQVKADAARDDKAVSLDPTTLASYVGRYQLQSGQLFVVTLTHHQLKVKFANQSAFPVFANARDKFFYRVVAATIDFERNPQGKVVALVLHQNGANLRAARVK